MRRHVDRFIFIFSRRILSPTLFLKTCTVEAKKLSWIFKIFLFPAATAKRHWAQCFGSRWVSRRISRLISLKYSPLQNFSEGQVHRFIMTDFVINFTLSKSSSLKITAVATLKREALAITTTNLRKKDLTYSSNIFQRPL